jgi:hypothetical protein
MNERPSIVCNGVKDDQLIGMFVMVVDSLSIPSRLLASAESSASV